MRTILRIILVLMLSGCGQETEIGYSKEPKKPEIETEEPEVEETEKYRMSCERIDYGYQRCENDEVVCYRSHSTSQCKFKKGKRK